jgi:hypothetical protein
MGTTHKIFIHLEIGKSKALIALNEANVECWFKMLY